jgi:hypothetical protein
LRLKDNSLYSREVVVERTGRAVGFESEAVVIFEVVEIEPEAVVVFEIVEIEPGVVVMFGVAIEDVVAVLEVWGRMFGSTRGGMEPFCCSLAMCVRGDWRRLFLT